eukprot:s5136_g5.t1
MDLDGQKDDKPRSPKGFRKRWMPGRADATEASDVTSVHSFDGSASGGFEKLSDDQLDLFALRDGLEDEPQFSGWEPIPFEDDGYEPESPLHVASSSSGGPLVFDPHRTESAWLNNALETATKRQKLHNPKLPWEIGPFSQIFRTGDVFQGTILDNYRDAFVPPFLGCHDVLHSVVTAKPHANASETCAEPPVLAINVKKVRHELPDEDIRRMAICKLRDLILQDPLATQLGVSKKAQTTVFGACNNADQSIKDCFRMKASSTLQKRAGSLWRLVKLLRGVGQLNPLRLQEEQLYEVLCLLRDSGAGATSAQHMIEALHFLDATAKFLLVDMHSVISGRLRSLQVESGHGETLIHADAIQSKTATSAEARTRFLPYVALGTGVTGADWGSEWLSARSSECLTFEGFTLPSFSERTAKWTANPMSASEATFLAPRIFGGYFGSWFGAQLRKPQL